ncbi:hypothetical protein GGF46_004488 [Coemansia sp. RSA 552]|nr:hypothetical protein GGF46_004488 [Coemansia sp. RSA 552]
MPHYTICTVKWDKHPPYKSYVSSYIKPDNVDDLLEDLDDMVATHPYRSLFYRLGDTFYSDLKQLPVYDDDDDSDAYEQGYTSPQSPYSSDEDRPDPADPEFDEDEADEVKGHKNIYAPPKKARTADEPDIPLYVYNKLVMMYRFADEDRSYPVNVHRTDQNQSLVATILERHRFPDGGRVREECFPLFGISYNGEPQLASDALFDCINLHVMSFQIVQMYDGDNVTAEDSQYQDPIQQYSQYLTLSDPMTKPMAAKTPGQVAIGDLPMQFKLDSAHLTMPFGG